MTPLSSEERIKRFAKKEEICIEDATRYINSMTPLSESEVKQILFASNNNQISEDTAVELLKNPNAARAYLNQPIETK